MAKKKSSKNPVGRPPIYKTAEQLQKKINLYFKTGVRKREVIIGKFIHRVPVPTISDLVLFCGFCNRASFYDLESNPEFSNTIKQARTFIERQYEEILHTGNCTGAIFALKNFGWIDKTETVLSGAVGVLTAKEVDARDTRVRQAAGLAG